MQWPLRFGEGQALLDNSRAIVTCLVAATDVYRAVKICESDAASLKGKTKQQRSEIVKIEHMPRNMVTTQTLHVSIMFVEGNLASCRPWSARP